MVVEPQFQLPVYTAQDFRFFDYFLQGAYPHQPIGNDAIWTHEIPILAPNVRDLTQVSGIELTEKTSTITCSMPYLHWGLQNSPLPH
jgi:hypothetical protein